MKGWNQDPGSQIHKEPIKYYKIFSCKKWKYHSKLDHIQSLTDLQTQVYITYIDVIMCVVIDI